MKHDHCTLEITLQPVSGRGNRVLLNGIDITRSLAGLSISAGVNEATRVDLRLTNVEVTGDIEAVRDAVVVKS